MLSSRTILALLATTAVHAIPGVGVAPAPPTPYDYISLAAAGKYVPETPTLAKRNIGGVRMAEGKDFTGFVWYGIWPLNTCISLGGYAGNLLSFRPDDGTECLVMQGRCNGNDEFADMTYTSAEIGDLSVFYWIGNATSYICLEQ